VLAVSERLEEFGGAEVAVVSFTDPTYLDAYVEHLGVSFPVVTDIDRDLYRALGIERGTRRQVWSLGTLREYWRLLRSGRRLQRSHEDIRQLGADVIVAADGTITKVFAPATPDARPTVDELLAALANT
jgi:peroxiredoxin